MKKLKLVFSVLFCIAIIISVCSCGFDSPVKNWEWVNTDDMGSMPVPPEWTVSSKEGFLYFSLGSLYDDDSKIYLVQANRFKDGEELINEELDSEYTAEGEVETLDNFESGASCGYRTVQKLGKTPETVKFLKIASNGQKIEFVSQDNVDYEILKLIAKYYKQEVITTTK